MSCSSQNPLLLFLFFSFIAWGCGPNGRDLGPKGYDGTEKVAKKGEGDQGQGSEWYISRPFRHDSLNYVLFPVVKPQGRESRSWNFSSGVKENERVRYHHHTGPQRQGHFLNLIRWDPERGAFQLLQDSLLHMTHFRYYPMFEKDRSAFFLYRLIPKDRNEDGEYRPNDGTALFYSLADGSGWKRLTPEGHRVTRVHVMPREGRILLRTETGPLGKGKVRFLATSLKDPGVAGRFFPAPFMKKLRGVLGKG